MTDAAQLPAADGRARSGRWSDHAVEQVIGRLLQVGVLVAAVVVVAGGALLLARHGGARPDYAVFRGTEPALRSVAGVVRGAAALDPRAVVQLGLALLIATPIARVALTLVAFVFQRDRLYVALTAVVLALLLFGLISGRG